MLKSDIKAKGEVSIVDVWRLQVNYNLLQPEDVEDLLALWLYDTRVYAFIPSTNKIATPKYECVLTDPYDLNRKHIYIHVKKGYINLNAEDYADLNEDAYL